ncbi:MAG: SipW-dependent-type signal peptide-containing protein [Longicatena sp.]
MKKKSTLLGTLALAGVLMAGGTYAYLQSTTEQAKNTFTMGAGISGELKEPNWDGECFKGETCNVPTTLGKTKAEKFTPGLTMEKNPIVKNTSTDTPAYVAVTIDYTGVTSLADLEKFATIDWSADWTFNANHTVAYYNNAVAAGEKTAPLFTNVTIKTTATQPSTPAASTDMKNFEITLNGYLAQTTDVADGSIKATLDTVFPDLAKK